MSSSVTFPNTVVFDPPSSAPICAKCAGPDFRIRWHRGRYGGSDGPRCGLFDVAAGDYETEPELDNEHLHHYCNTCQFDWRESVVTR